MAPQEMTLSIDSRYCGPPTSANGGYAAGLFARYLLEHSGLPVIGGPWAEVTLRAPVPLDAAMTVSVADEALTASQMGRLVAEARLLDVAPVDAVAVPPVSLERARAVSDDYQGLRLHPFPTCWVCGTDRPAGDGYHLQPGPVDRTRTACVWTVEPSAAGADGVVPVEAVWAALDCPGAWTALVEERIVVLGRLAAHVASLPQIGEECVVMGMRLHAEGRRTLTATTVYGADGREIGRALATWIEVSIP